LIRAGCAVLLILMMAVSVQIRADAVLLQDELVLTRGQSEFNAGPHLQWWFDTQSTGDIDNVLQGADVRWQGGGVGVPNLGYWRSPVWFRLQLENKNADADWNLVIDYPLIRDLSIYLVADGQVVDVHQLGDRFEFAARPVRHRNFVVPLAIAAGHQLAVFVRVNGPYAVQMPMKLMSSKQLLELDARQVIAHGLFFGFVMVMGIYNFFLFINSREVTYLYYVLFTFAIGLFQFVEQGFAFQFFWPKEVWWQNKATGALLQISLLTSFFFVNRFLELRKTIPWMYRCFQACVGFSLLALLSAGFVDDSWTIRFGVLIAIPSSGLCVLGGWIVWRQGREDARYFSIAWSAFLVGVLLLALNKLGMIPRNGITEHGAEVGTVIELGLLAFALAGRLNLARRRRQAMENHARALERAALAAKEHALELEKMNSEQLERNVRARTRDLHKAMSELSQVNKRLEQLNQTDAVTGVGNENCFIASLAKEWDRSYRESEVLSLIVVELDNYREILVEHGQVAADECLRAVAAIQVRLIARPADCITRYGDKVFGIILPATDEQGANYLAGRIVAEALSHPCDFGPARVQLSLSVGVAAMLPRKSGQYNEILVSAEGAVYVARHSGGSRVEQAGIND